jgi:hypothetical protein
MSEAEAEGEGRSEKKVPATPGVPKRSPIQVLTGPYAAYLPRSDGIGSVLRGMVADDITHCDLLKAKMSVLLLPQNSNKISLKFSFN